MYVCMYVSKKYHDYSSLSSCRGASMDKPNLLSSLLPVVHRFWQVVWSASRILTELLYVGSTRPPWTCLAMWGGVP